MEEENSILVGSINIYMEKQTQTKMQPALSQILRHAKMCYQSATLFLCDVNKNEATQCGRGKQQQDTLHALDMFVVESEEDLFKFSSQIDSSLSHGLPSATDGNNVRKDRCK